VDYEIKIYTDLSDNSDPTSGVLSDTITGATTYAGTYTIPLNTEVSVEYGSYFSVVVNIPQGKAGIDAEYSYDYRNSSSPLNLVATASMEKTRASFITKICGEISRRSEQRSEIHEESPSAMDLLTPKSCSYGLRG
jgi:hypothetical protein